MLLFIIVNTMSESTVKTQGQVKWFNNKSGYGFISVKIGDETKDIFAHYSNITLNEKITTKKIYINIRIMFYTIHRFSVFNLTYLLNLII